MSEFPESLKSVLKKYDIWTPRDAVNLLRNGDLSPIEYVGVYRLSLRNFDLTPTKSRYKERKTAVPQKTRPLNIAVTEALAWWSR